MSSKVNSDEEIEYTAIYSVLNTLKHAIDMELMEADLRFNSGEVEEATRDMVRHLADIYESLEDLIYGESHLN